MKYTIENLSIDEVRLINALLNREISSLELLIEKDDKNTRLKSDLFLSIDISNKTDRILRDYRNKDKTK